MASRVDYGIDAPAVIRNLAIAAVVLGLLWSLTVARIWSGTFVVGSIRFVVGGAAIWPALGCGGMAVWMLWSSRVGKIRERERLLDLLQWNGGESVLDVGCGRGLMLVAAAKRLSSGRAVGIDIWRSEDLTRNSREATLTNAAAEGVLDRLAVETADMRKLPFSDASFDVIVSNVAIHNVYDRDGRAAAIREIARVLAPAGQVLIHDIRHIGEYAAVLQEAGIAVRRAGSRTASFLLMVMTFGSLRPGTIVGSRRSERPDHGGTPN